MRRKISLLVILAMSLYLSACSLEPTCKVSDCSETEIYEDGYCKYHYYENVGDNLLKDLIN